MSEVQPGGLRRWRVLTISLAVALATSCADPPRQAPSPVVDFGTPTAPLRRLTQAELNRTLRDLFPEIEIPEVTVSDGQPPPGSGAKFDGDVVRQTPSDLVVEQLRIAAIAVSAAAMARPDLSLPRQPTGNPDDQRAAGRELIEDLGLRALRRPLAEGESARYAALFDAVLEAEGFEIAARAVMQAFLQAPSFIYRVELGAGVATDNLVPVQGYEMASRLSYFLWGTMPDAALFERAADGSLDTEAGLLDEVDRMLTDEKAKDGVLAFFRQWLDLDRILTTNKDPATHPTYNEDLRRAMRTEADLFVESVMFDGDARLETLLTSNVARIDASLAALYGVPAPAADWDLVELPANQRAGLLTQAQFLAARAHAIEPAPVQRGVFVLDRLLCEPPPPPDGSIDTTPLPPEEGVLSTNRDRYAQHTFDPVCQGCHVAIDGVGFGFEGYDAIGRYRTVDNGLPVNDKGTLDGTAVGGKFHGPVELAAMLAKSEPVQRCVARHWFRDALGRKDTLADVPSLEGVFAAFIDSDADMRALLRAIIASPSFRFRPAVGGAS